MRTGCKNPQEDEQLFRRPANEVRDGDLDGEDDQDI